MITELLEHEQNPDKLTVIDRLAIVGKSGMGALTYYPEQSFSEENDNTDLDELAFQCHDMVQQLLDFQRFRLKRAVGSP